MTNMLASRLSGVKDSPSIAAKARVDALRAQGRTIIDFTLGEPDFATPHHIVEAGHRALDQGFTRYTAAPGIPALRQAIADKLRRENGLSFDASNIVVGSGAKHIIFNAFTATLNAGDEVIIAAPYWVSYPDMAALNGGVPVIVSCDESQGFKLSAEALQRAVTPRTRWLVLNTPNNPTGAVYSPQELAAIAAVLRMHPHVWIMTDEIYEHFVYGGAKHTSLLRQAADLAPRTLLVNGLSKAYAFTGWRIGYGAGPAALVKAIGLILTQSTTCASAVSQAAAVAALEGEQQCVEDGRKLFESRRNRMHALLSAIPGITCRKPEGAFYTFPNVSGLVGRRTADGKLLGSDVDVMMYLLEQAGVAAVDGSSYGAPGHLRLSFATSMDVIEAGCAAIGAAVAALAPGESAVAAA